MIKRPLVWILCAYLAGLVLAWQGCAVLIVVLSALFLFLLIYLFLFRIKNQLVNRRDTFLWSLPFLLMFGFCSMRGQLTVPVLEKSFDQEISCRVSGSISMIVKKQWGKALYLKNNVVFLSENDPYLCENVIVFCYDNQSNIDSQNGINNQSETKNQGETNNQGETIRSNNKSESSSQNNTDNHNSIRTTNQKKQDESLSQNYLVGNKITVYGTLKKFSEPSNPGQFNEKLYYQIENIDYKMIADKIIVTDVNYSRFHAFLDRLKHKLLQVYENILPEKEAGTLIAMLLGEKYLLDEEIKDLYQVNGISHVLAISGLHVSLIGMAVFTLLKKCKLPNTAAILCSAFFIYSYGVLTNFSVSTNRAVVMMIVMLLSSLFGKTYDMLSALALSALIILLQNPLQIFSAGFLLSFGAVLGIAVILPSLKKLFPVKNLVVDSLLISTSAQVTTTPFIIYFFYQFPTYGLIVNLIILPFVTVLTLTSLLAGLAGAVWLPLGIFSIGGADYILKFYEWICRIGSQLPGNLITVGKPSPFKLLIYFLLIAAFVWAVRKWEKWYTIFLPAIAFLVLFLPGKSAGLEITVLDVGQGDAIFMESKSGTTYLVDGGSGDVNKVGINRIQPFLLSNGIDRIDYAIVSHSDSDHISGIMELMEAGQVTIRYLVLPEVADKDKAYIGMETLAENKKIEVRYIRTGDNIRDGEINILCLNPTSDFTANSSNANSTVLSISYGEFDMLLTGDLEQEGEEQLIELLQNPKLWEKYRNMKGIGNNKDTKNKKDINNKHNIVYVPSADYDILKVAHHGSKNSTSEEFLKLIQPEYSIISCGKNNRYGHPHKELRDRLKQIMSEVEITYETGAITIRTDGVKMIMKGYLCVY